MSDYTEFKRLNFFPGFFTTADDWNAGETYHLEKLKLHNRGLHTPGIMPGIPDQLAVRATGGRTIKVMPGAALDGYGNMIMLGQPQTRAIPMPEAHQNVAYVRIKFHEQFADHVFNVQDPDYSGDTRIKETPLVEVAFDAPDNSEWLELARIVLTSDNADIIDPTDPDNPGMNEIDRRQVPWAGAIGVDFPRLDRDMQQALILLMQSTRQHFAALAGRFPTPSLEDVRFGALHLQMSATTIEPAHLYAALDTLSVVEQSSEQELGAMYAPALTSESEFVAFQVAINALRNALSGKRPLDIVFECQRSVAESTLTLARIIFPPPIADAGDDQSVETLTDEAIVTLDASRSKAGIGRQIVKYRWEIV